MNDINIGLTEEQRTTIITDLAQYLADSHVLFTKTQGFHWNLVSSDFHELHKAFQEQYEDIATAIDDSAERIRALGGQPTASLAKFVEASQLKEVTETMSDQSMVNTLLADHEAIICWMRDAIVRCQAAGDEGTTDYFIGRIQVHEKTAWMLRSTRTA